MYRHVAVQEVERVVALLLSKENDISYESKLNGEQLTGIVCMVAETFLVVIYKS